MPEPSTAAVSTYLPAVVCIRTWAESIASAVLMAGRSRVRRTRRLARNLEHEVVDVAEVPVLAGLERLDQRMFGCVRVLRCVLVGRRITTADMPALGAAPEAHPPATRS